MADTLTINFLGSIQTKVNNSITDIVEIADRDATGSLKFETTITLAAGATSSQVVLPSSVGTIGKYLCISSDLDIVVSLNGTTNLIPTRLLLLKASSTPIAAIYLTNANSSDATVRIYLAG